MEIKLLEIRDRATFIPVMAIKPGSRDEQERYLLARTGYGRMQIDQESYVILMQLETCKAQNDVYDWSNQSRTMQLAHLYILNNWYQLQSGSVVDVEFISKETQAPKVSERLTAPL